MQTLTFHWYGCIDTLIDNKTIKMHHFIIVYIPIPIKCVCVCIYICWSQQPKSETYIIQCSINICFTNLQWFPNFQICLSPKRIPKLIPFLFILYSILLMISYNNYLSYFLPNKNQTIVQKLPCGHFEFYLYLSIFVAVLSRLKNW